MPLTGSNLPHSVVVEEGIIHRVFSLGRCHEVTEGYEDMRPEARTEKRSRESSAVLRVCERPNVRDVYSPWGDVTLVTEGNESHEARYIHDFSPVLD